MGYPSRASEFPNDNVDISSGTRWLSERLVGAVTAELPLEEEPKSAVHAPVPSERFVLCLEEEETYFDEPLELRLTADGPVVVVEREAPPALRHFQSALVQALMTRGASRAAALVPSLLELQPLTAESLSPELSSSLVRGRVLDENLRYSNRFRSLCGAWSAVLSGTSDDFSACGATTLDGFGAELLATLLIVPATRADELRRELRKAGIAAFGVLEAAA